MAVQVANYLEKRFYDCLRPALNDLHEAVAIDTTYHDHSIMPLPVWIRVKAACQLLDTSPREFLTRAVLWDH